MPGLRNVGLLATQELRVGVPRMAEWPDAARRARPLLGLRGQGLVKGLGFGVEMLSTGTSILTVNGRNRAVAVFCDDDEPFDAPARRFAGASPVSRGLADADRLGADWVVLTRAAEIRLYAARPDTGVGRKGRAETFVEANLSLLPAEFAGYLHVLFSADALAAGGLIEGILERSADFAADLAVRLRERVYFKTVPALASALARRLGHEATPSHLDAAYEQVMVILFRLLFVAYAEDKDLLPYRTNSHYADHSLKLRARRLTEDRRAGRADYDESATDLWDDVRQLWRAVDTGNSGWGVPAYNGGLFSHEPDVSPPGAALATLQLTDAEFAPALSALLVDEGDEGYGPVDFRLLSVREFGTIYEGLLESTLAVAQDDLAVRKVKGQEQYVPAKANEAVEVPAGAAYLHNRSGVRKATGSYFTKPFAVEHLLEHALKPALDDHISRLDALSATGDDASLAEAFFDFRCADVAMGSGHFLVAALDRIETRLSAWLAQHPVPGVSAELDRLRYTALDALGDLEAGVEIDSTSLLRRQVARHCVYGVDRNRVAVELARLSIWVHTFVPGLPLSLLDHNLICGNSLTGIGTLDEAIATLEGATDPDATSLFRGRLLSWLDRAEGALRRLAVTSDATKREIDEAREAHLRAYESVSSARAVFDLIVAHRADTKRVPLPVNYDEETFIRESRKDGVITAVRVHRPVHFPAVWPEVFRAGDPGFDCILGNPPWEKVKIERQVWWGQHLPKIRQLGVSAMNAEIDRLEIMRPDLAADYERDQYSVASLKSLLRVAYSGIGPGDTDLYQAFTWRNWQLAKRGGRIGIVLPRAALQTKGSEEWRKTVLADGEFSYITVLTNSGRWVFDDVHGQFTVGLCSIRKGRSNHGVVTLSGPYASRDSYDAATENDAQIVPVTEFMSWSDDASLPQLPPHPGSLRLFRRIRAHPRLDRKGQPLTRPPWRARPHTDLHSTSDKFRFFGDDGHAAINEEFSVWPVYGGRSFNLWNPDTGIYYDSVDSTEITDHLRRKRRRQHLTARSPFAEFPVAVIDDPNSLPCLRPRIAVRKLTRSTDTRTTIAALVPGQVVITDHAPFLLWPTGTVRHEALILGVLSSMILDWYARRIVERNVTFHILNNFPIPDADTDGDPVAGRVVEIAGRLAAVDDRYDDWAAAVGVPVGSVGDDDLKYDLVCELDACVAVLYGLDESDLAVVYETFHEGADYSARHAAVLGHFRRWQRQS